LLPSSATKASIHRLYEQSVESAGLPVVLYSKFVTMWNELWPLVRITKPMTDLCHTCQKNNSNIYRSANLLDEEKRRLYESRRRIYWMPKMREAFTSVYAKRVRAT